MTNIDLYHMIDLQPEIIEKLTSVKNKLNLGEIEWYLNHLMNIETAPEAYQSLKKYLQPDTGNIKMLYCQLECARYIYRKYQERKIPDTIFIDTMKCFPRFLNECAEKNGVLFFDRGWWTYRQISMNIFRIGDLEYQFKEFNGKQVIALHIPSDAVFSTDAVDASFVAAELFFITYFPEYRYTEYTCNSWLLSPTLKLLLPTASNIRTFQERFKIIHENPKDHEYIEWLFQKPQDTDSQNLPEKTSLQRKVKKLILNGGTIGSAFGIVQRNEKPESEICI